ncbi:MAG: hypothetical protein PHE55_10185 [Methylococcaceae bacterium]|nr:hypothetical protein [Methylococcaceae bacterium]
MKTQRVVDEEKADLDWLAQRIQNVGSKEECYFCNTIREVLARGWELMDARNYALGKVMGAHSR